MEFTQLSNVIFNEFVGEKVVSPSYSYAILGLPLPLQCSCLETSIDRGAWQVTVHGIAKSWT